MTAALDAIARIDEGMPLPGDRTIADIFDQHCQWEALRYDDRLREIEYADWLAGQCGGCHDGGTGEPCDEHDGGEGGS